MLTENMMCLPLYNDMASIIFGLYEDNDERLPYSLFVVGIDKNKMHIFTSEEHIECNDQNIQTMLYKEWIKNNSNIRDIPRRSILRYEPYVTSYKLSNPKQTYDDTFFENLFGIKKMDLLICWHVYNNRVFILLYKDKTFTKNYIPTLMWDVCEKAYDAWYLFFEKGLYKNAQPPRIDVNEIIESIESIDNFKEMATYFKTVTKISSLFYEKTRSKGSITIMGKKADHLILFKTDTEEEALSLSMEHAKLLRKLLETTKNELSMLVYDGKIYGIGKPTPENIQYIFNLTGQMEWHIIAHRAKEKDSQLLRYKHGKYYLPSDVKIQNRKWYINNKIKDDAVKKTVNNLLKEEDMEAFKHGALLIITVDAKDEVDRLCEKKRGLRTEPINIMSNFDKTSALCAIDGALFLDKEGNCHGIGIILDGEAIVNGTPVRGSRYNSAKTYISRCAAKGIDAYALVISTDGNYDILTTGDDEFKPIKDVQRKEDAV